MTADAKLIPGWRLRLPPEPAGQPGTESFPVTAAEVTGDEHDRLYGIRAERYPGFAKYRERTDRVIPVIELIRAES